MQRITVEIKKVSALKSLQKLEHEHANRILSDKDLDLLSLPGEPISVLEFKQWIKNAEKSPLVSLNEAKEIWLKKKDFTQRR